MYSTQHSDMASRKSLEVGNSSCDVFVAREARISATILVTVAAVRWLDERGCRGEKRGEFEWRESNIPLGRDKSSDP